MTDNKSLQARHRNMAAVRSENTRPEILVRRTLFSLGFRFRLHRKDLPGCPDIVMPKYRVAVFVNGCFWHAHAGCRRASVPESHRDFWTEKLKRNTERDHRVREELLKSGWRVLWVWECALTTRDKREVLPQLLKIWIDGSEPAGEIPPQPTR